MNRRKILFSSATTGEAGTIVTRQDGTGDPAFVNPAAGNYHIGQSSAAKDHGVDADVATDIDGEARPQGGGYDLGADEWTSRRNLYLPQVMKG